MRRGFTLIELSIVLVIIGLIVGGVLVGKELVHQAELRTISADIEKYKTVYYTFRNKYNYYPGDMPNATMFWGRADGGADTTQNCAAPDTDTDPANAQATCNGNGDGVVARIGTVVTDQYESFRFWQHLFNAGLISTQASGIGGAVDGTGWRTAVIGGNIPGSKALQGGFFINYASMQNLCTAPNVYSGLDSANYYHLMMFGKEQTSGPPRGYIFTPTDAYSLDLKIDDGKPGLGQLRAICPNQCADTTDAQTAVYDTSLSTIVCHMRFVFK